MPQLDHFSFFSQVFWVLFFFTTFYFLNLRQILPAIAAILKVRRRVLQKSQDTFDSMQSSKTTSILESHTEFFAFTKTFSSVSLVSVFGLARSLKVPFVKDSFDLEVKKVAPKSLALDTFSLFVRKSS